jgi:glutaconate CoA-transferase subunit B
MMVTAAARRIKDGSRILVGIGMPNLAANLAKRLHAPNSILIYEAGIIAADPSRLPLSIGDPCLVTGAQSICSMFEVFSFYVQGGLIDIGFLGAAQIDRFGNVNTTTIGRYDQPKVRLPGSGGACEIASLARKVFLLIPHEKRRFVPRADFITSPGFLQGRQQRNALNLSGEGPEVVITDLGVLEFSEDGEMVLVSVHPGVEVEKVRENTGWDLKVSSDLRVTEPPTRAEIELLRELDPTGLYLLERRP